MRTDISVIGIALGIVNQMVAGKGLTAVIP